MRPNFFGTVRFFLKFFCLQRVLFDFIEVPLVISGVKGYIRTFDVISELYCVLIRRRCRFENRSFSRKHLTYISNLRLLSLRYSADFRRSRLVQFNRGTNNFNSLNFLFQWCSRVSLSPKQKKVLSFSC